MTSALLGLGFILLIAVVTVVLGGLTRLLAGTLGGPGTAGRGPDPPVRRIARGNEMTARDLRPDQTHVVARTARRDAPDRSTDHAQGAAAEHAYPIHALR